MGKFRVTRLPLEGLLLIEPEVHYDQRGFFTESYNKRDFSDLGLDAEFVQDNHSRSVKGVLRGLHYQLRRPQDKLVRVVRGRVFDVAVDLRRSSATFGKWFGVILSDENKSMLWVPKGFAHGFLVLSEVADVVYKVTDYYDSTDDHGIVWDDPDVGIEWPLEGALPLLSEKDARWPSLREASHLTFEY